MYTTQFSDFGEHHKTCNYNLLNINAQRKISYRPNTSDPMHCLCLTAWILSLSNIKSLSRCSLTQYNRNVHSHLCQQRPS